MNTREDFRLVRGRAKESMEGNTLPVYLSTGPIALLPLESVDSASYTPEELLGKDIEVLVRGEHLSGARRNGNVFLDELYKLGSEDRKVAREILYGEKNAKGDTA